MEEYKFPENLDLETFWEGLEEGYNDIIQFENSRAEKIRKKISSLDTNDILREYSKLRMASLYKFIHENLMFFEDKHLLDFFNKLGVKKDVLRWFVTLDEIQEQFRIIESRGIQVYKAFVLQNIRCYFDGKFSIELLYLFTEPAIHDEVTMTNLTKTLIDIKRRMGTPKKLKNEFEVSLYELINIGDKLYDKFSIDRFIEITKGKEQKIFIKDILEKGFEYNKKLINETEFYNAVYDLFKIIMKDKVFEDEAEFDLRRISANRNTGDTDI